MEAGVEAREEAGTEEIMCVEVTVLVAVESDGCYDGCCIRIRERCQ